jgi:hypothetical protein
LELALAWPTRNGGGVSTCRGPPAVGPVGSQVEARPHGAVARRGADHTDEDEVVVGRAGRGGAPGTEPVSELPRETNGPCEAFFLALERALPLSADVQ